MTISSTTRTAGAYPGTGAQTAFPFAFKVLQASDLYVVSQLASTGVETVLTLTSDYSVALNLDQNSNPGGTVSLVVAPAIGVNITLSSNVAPLQTTDLTNQGGFYPSVITDALDRLTILIQQVIGSVGRSLKFPISDGSSLTPTLPSASSRALRALVFDAEGNVSVSDDIYTNQTAAAAASATAAAGSAASAGSSATTATTAASAASASAAGAATSATASAGSASSAAASAATALAAASGGGNTVTNPLIQQQFGGF